MKVTHITFTVDNDGVEETVHAEFGRYGWNQWGAQESTLWETVPLLEAIEELAATNDEVRALVAVDDPDEP